MVCPAHGSRPPRRDPYVLVGCSKWHAMLLAVVGSGYLMRRLPVSLPLPLWQIALGAVSAGVFNQGAALAPEIFFLLFLLPLLFLDDWRNPTSGLPRNKATILVRGGWWGSPWSGPVS